MCSNLWYQLKLKPTELVWLGRPGDNRDPNDKSADQQVQDYVRGKQAEVYQQLEQLQESLRNCLSDLHELEHDNAKFWGTLATAKEVATQRISTEVAGIMNSWTPLAEDCLRELKVVVLTQDFAAKLTGGLGGGFVAIHVLRNCLIELGIIDNAQRSTTLATLAVLSRCQTGLLMFDPWQTIPEPSGRTRWLPSESPTVQDDIDDDFPQIAPHLTLAQ